MIRTMRVVVVLLTSSFLVLGILGCESAKHFTTTMEVLEIERFKDPRGIVTLGLELRYAECPGDARRIVRADSGFASCASALKPGEKVKAELYSTWQSDRGSYRSDILRLGDCAMKLDPKDESNYEMVQTCSDIVATGAIVGVHCDRTRSKAMVDKCPWLRRR